MYKRQGIQRNPEGVDRALKHAGVGQIELVTPVSYTHLDVYKRQPWYTGGRSSFFVYAKKNRVSGNRFPHEALDL